MKSSSELVMVTMFFVLKFSLNESLFVHVTQAEQMSLTTFFSLKKKIHATTPEVDSLCEENLLEPDKLSDISGFILTSIPMKVRWGSSITFNWTEHATGFLQWHSGGVTLHPSGDMRHYLSTEGWQRGCSSWGKRYVIPTTPTTRKVKGPTYRASRVRQEKT